MSQRINRREFIQRSTGAALALGVSGSPPMEAASSGDFGARGREGPKKSVLYGMLPGSLSMEDRFKLARDVGFEGVEAPPITDLNEAEKMRQAAEKAGIRIHSIIYGGWHAPLSSADPGVIERALKEIEAVLRAAHTMGAEGILLVPAVVNASTRYVHAYQRSQRNVRRLIPIAEQWKVMILIEEVWNNFLLSPLEFARYIDEFRSPWVQAYFDVGNVVRFAWPEDWIRTLGKRIKKVHIKDFKGGPGLGTGGEWVNLLEGSINWPEVRRAFAEIGFTGYMTTELGGGDEAYLRDVSARVDKILAAA